LLNGLIPDRIDLGIGRGLGADDKEIIKALSGNESIKDPGNFNNKLKSLKTFLGSGKAPELWLLGSSVRSAEFAGRLGLSFGALPEAKVDIGHLEVRID